MENGKTGTEKAKLTDGEALELLADFMEKLKSHELSSRDKHAIVRGIGAMLLPGCDLIIGKEIAKY